MPRAVEIAVKYSQEFENKGGMGALMDRFKRTQVNVDLLETLDHIRGARELVPAIPTGEPVGSKFDLPTSAIPIKVAGIDGSQIYPSEDAAVKWAFVRAIGVQGDETIETGHFFDASELETESNDSAKRLVDNWREAYESEIIVQAVNKWPKSLVLTDGSLLPWSGMEKDMESVANVYRENIEKAKGSLLAGVISSPRSKYCMNLLRVSLKAEKGDDHNINVSDTNFFRSYLEVGQRSAVFLHGSPVNDTFSAAIHMFYLKVSKSEVLRVEFPTWVATNKASVDVVHSSIFMNCQGLEYPYNLIKAHNSVKISQDIANGLQKQADLDYVRKNGYPIIQSAKVRLKNACS